MSQYCFILHLYCFNFNVLADIRCLCSSMAVLKPLAFILYLVFSSNFNLVLPFPHHPLNQSSILLSSFLKIVISFSILRFRNGSFLFMVRSVLTQSFSQTNNAPALPTYLRSDKFLIEIHFSTSFTSFTSLVTKFTSLLCRVEISPFTPSCIISIRRW